MNLVYYYILPLVITIIIEFSIYWAVIKKNPTKLFLYSFLINSLTLPLANYAFINYLHNFIIIEASVFLSEFFLVHLLIKPSYKIALFLSFAANSISAFLGIIIFL